MKSSRTTIIEKAVKDNPDLPVKFIKDTLLGVEEIRSGQTAEYKFKVKSCQESLMHEHSDDVFEEIKYAP
jgi:hypothetical protein